MFTTAISVALGIFMFFGAWLLAGILFLAAVYFVARRKFNKLHKETLARNAAFTKSYRF